MAQPPIRRWSTLCANCDPHQSLCEDLHRYPSSTHASLPAIIPKSCTSCDIGPDKIRSMSPFLFATCGASASPKRGLLYFVDNRHVPLTQQRVAASQLHHFHRGYWAATNVKSGVFNLAWLLTQSTTADFQNQFSCPLRVPKAPSLLLSSFGRLPPYMFSSPLAASSSQQADHHIFLTGRSLGHKLRPILPFSRPPQLRSIPLNSSAVDPNLSFHLVTFAGSFAPNALLIRHHGVAVQPTTGTSPS